MNDLEKAIEILRQLAEDLGHTPTFEYVNSRLKDLQSCKDQLTYHSTPVKSWSPSVSISIHVKCEAPECVKTSADPDSCMLKFKTGQWLCRDHHIPLTDTSVHPPGWTIDEASRAAEESARKIAMGKLEISERQLINRNIVR